MSAGPTLAIGSRNDNKIRASNYVKLQRITACGINVGRSVDIAPMDPVGSGWGRDRRVEWPILAVHGSRPDRWADGDGGFVGTGRIVECHEPGSVHPLAANDQPARVVRTHDKHDTVEAAGVEAIGTESGEIGGT